MASVEDPNTAEREILTVADLMDPGPPPARASRRDLGEIGVAYEEIADKVGMVPNVRARDNVLQGAFVAACSLAAGALGAMNGGGTQGFLMGLGVGLAASGLLSGLALMITGLVRR